MEKKNQKVNILLVDDVPANLLGLEAILQAPDRNLVRASSGEEALRFLLDEDAAVILLDVHMPSIGGLETAALIRGRERTRDVPIIFLTAHDNLGDKQVSQGYSLGAVDYIIKPIDPEALKAKVAVFVELYRKTEQIRRQAELLREQNIEIENANLRRLSRLIDLGQELATERNPAKVLEKFCDAAREIVGARYGTVGIVEEDGVTLSHFFTCGFDGDGSCDENVPKNSQRFLSQRFKSARSLRLATASRLRIVPEKVNVKTFVGAPILQQGQVRGWLYLFDKIGASEFSEADEQFTVTLTQSVVFYENARLYAELHHHAGALEQEITDRKQAEAQARAAQAEAEKANRLKDEFLATVSHELRAPLGAMLGWVTLARKDSLDQKTKERALETVERNARVQKKLIDDLLDVSSIITGNLRLCIEPTDLLNVIDQSVESVRPAAEAKSVRLYTSLGEMVDLFPLDPHRFQQVIWNLVYNAVKFTPSGGSVHVRLQYIGHEVVIEVIDTGVGIAPEFLPFVFDRFRQADGSITRKHGGLGLGLAIVRYLVELHGGTVQVESAGENQGSTFRVRLPRPSQTDSLAGVETSAMASREFMTADSTPRLSGLRALVVDDESDARELLATILRLKDADVRMAGSVAEAMNIFDAWRPEIVISDIAMPGGGGYELIRNIRSSGSQVPAIAVTAHVSDEARRLALAAGFQTHLPKPVEPSELVMTIHSLTRGS
jgi:signal transduction histidine kinase